MELNQKSTILTAGLAGTFGKIFAKTVKHDYKKSGDLLLGISQLLGPTTILTVNFTAGFSHGFLSDPYKGMHFLDYPDPNNLFMDNRPRKRTKEIGFFSLRQFV